MRQIKKILLVAFVLYFFISGWLNIPDKLFSVIDGLKKYLPDGWTWSGALIDAVKYLLDKVGWAIILFLIQKHYEKRQTSCPPVRCKLLASRPVKYDSQLHKLCSTAKLELGLGRYYYHFRLQLNAEDNAFFNLSIRGLGFNKLQLDTIKNNETVVVDLVVYYVFEKVIEIFPIIIVLSFQDTYNAKYKERLVLIRKNGAYFCRIKTPKKL